jgi:anaerobic ribonucleoside-triphosphate reductase
MQRIIEIEAEQERLRAQLNEVRGTPCEVYTRIVGYMRNIQNWNEGKKAELTQRMNFRFPDRERIAG